MPNPATIKRVIDTAYVIKFLMEVPVSNWAFAVSISTVSFMISLSSAGRSLHGSGLPTCRMSPPCRTATALQDWVLKSSRSILLS